MTYKPTRGPYLFDPETGFIYDPNGRSIANVSNDDYLVEGANGRLLAASWTLLNIVSWCVNHDGECLADHAEILQAAKSAITELEGAQ